MSVEVGTEETTAFLRINNGQSDSGIFKWDATIKAPLEKSSKELSITDFSSLQNAATINISFSATCITGTGGCGVDDSDKLKPLFEAQEEVSLYYCEAIECDETTATKYFKSTNDTCTKYNDTGTTEEERCNEHAEAWYSRYLSQLDEIENELIKEEMINPVHALIYGFSAEIGPKSFSFLEPDSLESSSSTETLFSLEASVDYLSGRTSWGAGFTWSKNFNEQSQQELCSPLADGLTTLSCKDARIGGPTEIERKAAFIRLHKFFSGLNVAIQPKISFDFEEDVYAIDVPIFLKRDIAGKFNSGIKLGWESENKDFVASVFIGRSFTWF